MANLVITQEAAVAELKRRGRWPGTYPDNTPGARETATKSGAKGLSGNMLRQIAEVDIDSDPRASKTKERKASYAAKKAAKGTPETGGKIATFDKSNPLGLSVPQIAARKAIREMVGYGEAGWNKVEGAYELFASSMDSAGVPRLVVKSESDTTRPTTSRGKRLVTEGDDKLARAFCKAHEVKVPRKVAAKV